MKPVVGTLGTGTLFMANHSCVYLNLNINMTLAASISLLANQISLDAYLVTRNVGGAQEKGFLVQVQAECLPRKTDDCKALRCRL